MSRRFIVPRGTKGQVLTYPTRNFAHLLPTFRLGVDYLFIQPEGVV